MNLNGAKVPLFSLLLGLAGGFGSAIWWTSAQTADLRQLKADMADVRGTLKERQGAVTRLEVQTARIDSLEAHMSRCEGRLFGTSTERSL